MRRFPNMFTAIALLSLMATGGLTGPAEAAPAKSPIVVASAAQIVSASKVCARHMTADNIDTAAIMAEGWTPFEQKAWPDRTFPSYARFFSRNDGVILETAVANKIPNCIIYARRAAGQKQGNFERDLTAAFGAAPAHKDGTQTLWAIGGILYVLTSDEIDPDAINIIIGQPG